jgi:hypothetical protein
VANPDDIVGEHGRCRMQPAAASVAQVTFHGEAATVILGQYQRLALTTAIAMGPRAIARDTALLAACDRWLQGKG